MTLRIAPSLLAADFGRFAEAAIACQQGEAEYLHFDVMDGRFVPPITYGSQLVDALRPRASTFFDVHLMIIEPERQIENFAEAGADGITVHAEACLHLHRTLGEIKRQGKRCGCAINPATSLSAVEYVLPMLDLLLIMTVNPGYGGQSFIQAMLAKVEAARELIDRNGYSVEIEVDGGIDNETAPLAAAAGAEILVAGTHIFRHPEGISAAIRGLKSSIASVDPSLGLRCSGSATD
ncbi:MAG: ribulose-phosphate 3-epimerase [Armatimonadetes bacterium]|nr:ribulose-phosphate 3-epimerase [Armatimonadota bacterium]